MKKRLIFIVIVLLAGCGSTQWQECRAQTMGATPTTHTVHLAIVSGEAKASAAADLLTVELSKCEGVTLLERDQINKALTEQALSAGGSRDYLKLGEILGADGLVILDLVERDGGKQVLSTRLAAVKPGVVLGLAEYNFPLTEPEPWSKLVVGQFEPLFPKLGVLTKDAVPISLLNLRSAAKSAESEALERELNALLISRLMREKEVFVLERQKMQDLAQEKEFKGVAVSAFWDGSYLLEGTVDKAGFNRETVTVSARLSPPGREAVEIEVTGRRAELPPVINELALKVLTALKKNSENPDWKPADEAARYFEEAKWGLKWGMLKESEAAVESAWALGKQDEDCAMVRINAYAVDAKKRVGGYPVLVNASIRETDSEADYRSTIREYKKEAEERHAFGLAYDPMTTVREVRVGCANNYPEPVEIELAERMLELYLDFNRTLPVENTKLNSPWNLLGLDTLKAASEVLQHFHFIPEAQVPVKERLAQLRALARDTAAMIGNQPGVKESYWVGDRVATHDELEHFAEQPRSLYALMADYGCFWQETPEEGVAMYRLLMSSPVYSYIDGHLWFRELQCPRLAGWSEEERQRRMKAWGDFMGELDGSTNFMLRIEARCLALSDARTDEELLARSATLFDAIFANETAIVNCNVELRYSMGAFHLVWDYGTSMVTPAREKLKQRYRTEYGPHFSKMEAAYWKHLDTLKDLARVQAQKQFLLENKPYDFFEFNRVFGFRNYTRDQATELLPPVQAYKSNLSAQAEGKPLGEATRLRDDANWVGMVERDLRNAVIPPFVQQRQLLTNGAPFDGATLSAVFAVMTYSKVEAVELQPLLLTYRSNLVTQSTGKTGPELTRLQNGVAIIDRAEKRIEQALNAPEPQAAMAVAAAKTKMAVAQANASKAAPATNDSPTVTNEDFLAVQRFLPIPVDELPGEDTYAFGGQKRIARVDGHKWSNGKLLFDVEDAVAIFDLENLSWTVVPLPPLGEGASGRPSFKIKAIEMELHKGKLFIVQDELPAAQGNFLGHKARMSVYDFKTDEWRRLEIPMESIPRLYSIDGHLYGANEEGVIEFKDDGKTTRLLASTRRRPAASALDTLESLGAALLFRGPGGQLRIVAGPTIYAWDGTDWRAQPTPAFDQMPEANEHGLILRSAPFNKPVEIWLIASDKTNAELVWREPYQGSANIVTYPSTNKSTNETITPAWKTVRGFYLNHASALPDESGLFFLINHLGRQSLTSATMKPRPDERMATLARLDRDFDLPLAVELKFDAARVPLPNKFIGMNYREGAWVLPTKSCVLIGQGESPGVWVIPRSEVEAAIGRDKQRQKERILAEAAAVEKHHQYLLAVVVKYDLNKNGVIEPEERAGAIDDPLFLEAQLDLIDTNHDGLLDAAELRYFDVDQNGILNARAEAGIRIVQGLLASKIIKEFDEDGDDLLSQAEFALAYGKFNLGGAGMPPGLMGGMPGMLAPGLNPHGQVDATLLKTILDDRIKRQLRIRTRRVRPVMPPSAPIFKELVEAYWQHPGTNAPVSTPGP